MKHFFYWLCLVSIQLIVSCNDTSTQPAKDTTVDSIKHVAGVIPAPPFAPPQDLKVKARLVYADGTLSKFDVLNDKSVALWNVIIGGGDAEQHSDKVKLILSGSFDSLSVVVKNGKKVAINEKNVTVSGDKIYQLSNTGCEEVIVDIQRNAVVKYHDTIPFRCGE